MDVAADQTHVAIPISFELHVADDISISPIESMVSSSATASDEDERTVARTTLAVNFASEPPKAMSISGSPPPIDADLDHQDLPPDDKYPAKATPPVPKEIVAEEVVVGAKLDTEEIMNREDPKAAEDADEPKLDDPSEHPEVVAVDPNVVGEHLNDEGEGDDETLVTENGRASLVSLVFVRFMVIDFSTDSWPRRSRVHEDREMGKC